MANELVVQLKGIRDKVNDMPIDDAKAKELENLISKSIEIIEKIKNPADDFFETRRQSALIDLNEDLHKHIKGYWGANTKTEKIAEFSRARNDVNFVLNRILASFRR